MSQVSFQGLSLPYHPHFPQHSCGDWVRCPVQSDNPGARLIQGTLFLQLPVEASSVMDTAERTLLGLHLSFLLM